MKSNELLQKIIQNWPVKILAVCAALFLFWLNRVTSLQEKIFYIPVTLSVNENFLPAGGYPDRIKVTLRSDAENIDQIKEDNIHAIIDLTARTQEGTFRAPILIRKSGIALNVDPLEIRSEPLELEVKIERKLIRYLEVNPVFEGQPTPGYELVQSFATPTTVSVEGPRSHLEKVSTINTQPIDLSGKKEDFSLRVRVEVPDPLLRIRGNDTVEFRANMEESLVVKTYQNVGIIVLGLDHDLRVISSFPDGTITVQGSQIVQESLGPEQVRLIVDASIINAQGTYLLPVVPDLPAGFVVLSYEPSEVAVHVGNYGS